MRLIHIILMGFFASVIAAAGAEIFYLKGTQSQKMFGPYEYAQGATVAVGKVTFEIVRSTPVAEAARHPEAERAALAAAEAWLRIIDRQAFGEAWDQSAAYLKLALSRADFEKSLQAVQDTLGGTVTREAPSVQYTESLPSAPDGQYVIIQYKVVRERKAQAVETIVPMLDDDGTWRISGYYVR